MSLQAISWVLDHSQSDGLARLVFICMAHHDDGGIVGVSKATIAEEARVSEATVWRAQRALQDLEELEELNPRMAPKWWCDIDPRRRPKLWVMTLFLASRSAMAEAVDNVRLASRRDRAGVAANAIRSNSSNSSSKAKRFDEPVGGRFRGELTQVERCPRCTCFTFDCTCSGSLRAVQ